MSRRRNVIVAAGLLAFASAGLAFPFYMATRSSKAPIIDSSKPLPPQATFRGPYINSGSRDVGPDYQTYSKKTRSSKTHVIDSSKPVPPQATFRGPYLNSGLRDIEHDYKTYSRK